MERGHQVFKKFKKSMHLTHFVIPSERFHLNDRQVPKKFKKPIHLTQFLIPSERFHLSTQVLNFSTNYLFLIN